MKFLRDKQGMSCSEIERDKVDWKRAHDIIENVCASDKRIYPIPFSFIKNDNLDTLNIVMQALGLYTFPTYELCEWLESQIDDNPEYEPHSAIEICAGTGWIGRQLGIPSTDIKNMENPIVKNVMLEQLGIPTIYTDDVEKLEASEAVNKYSPDIVIGSYVTSKQLMDKIDKKRAITIGMKMPHGGVIEQNLMDIVRKEIRVGVNVQYIIRKVYKTILIINGRTHMHEPYLSIPHESLSFPWLITRGDNSQSRILIYTNKNWQTVLIIMVKFQELYLVF